jgi:hypothetical protein
MPLNRIFEASEVSPEVRRIFEEIRIALDLPYVPSILNLLAGNPEYLRVAWKDLGLVATSREFMASANAMEEFVRSRAVSGAWRLGDQERLLANQKISTADMPVLAGVVGIFARTLPRLLVFCRLLQRGYSGGQRGRVSASKETPALSRLIRLHIPAEHEAGLRTWMIYNDMKRKTGATNVMDMFRVLTPFPGYLAAVWQDSKTVIADPGFQRARDEIARRSMGLTSGLPVGDHREMSRSISPKQWKEIEQAVDGYARQLPLYLLLAWVWRRSFAVQPDRQRAA